ncbi:hypothetical protein [Hymenobacter sp. B81]|uniref:hypothetical protein n=1 Tax=Hymenobacter sp. B81 TaxID=3344878 RepID=UPI0037DD0BB1
MQIRTFSTVLLLGFGLLACQRNEATPSRPEVDPVLKKVSWSADEYRLMEYDDRGRLQTLAFHWKSAGPTPTSEVETYRFNYDANGNPASATTSLGLSYKYYYSSNGELQKTEEFDRQGQLVVVRNYVFSNGRLAELLITPTSSASGGSRLTRKSFFYDAAGNLVRESFAEKGANQTAFQEVMSTEYSGFDNHPNPDNLLISYPHFDPRIVYQKFNPTKAVTREAGGRTLESQWTLTYDQAGLVIKKTIITSLAQAPQTISYEYQ